MQSLEGESFMDLIAASAKEEGGQHVQGWVRIEYIRDLKNLPEIRDSVYRFVEDLKKG